MIKIKLHNTLTRKKQIFVPLDENNVRLYLCGPTVYDRAHLGNARNVIMFDVLYRLLIQVYGKKSITYVRNFTDIDDKINNKSLESGRPITDITSETIQWYLDDMAALGNLEPNLMPKATDYIPQMINFIERLITEGFAYVEEGHVLFSVSKYKNYGKLSGRSVEDMIAGARVEIASYKRDPMDFVLWKPSEKNLPGWESPWGRGRPGWHIECSAMAHDILGATFDIHGGGNDLQFPHHENEIAQSCCTSANIEEPDSYAKYWMHNGFVTINGEKMAKSLGNIILVKDLAENFHGEVIRLALLSSHYRQGLDWNEKVIHQANKLINKLYQIKDDLDDIDVSDTNNLDTISILMDDLNTPGLITELNRIVKEYNSSSSEREVIKNKLHLIGSVLGILEDDSFNEVSEEFKNKINELISKRSEAKKNKDFELADAIREQLIELGVEINDLSDGTEWKLKS